MDIQNTIINVADYCAMYDRSEISVNRNYQRSDKVWPKAAKTFLIETILLGYPIPKLFLHQKTDVKTRESFKDVVDGQQRTSAIVAFYHDQHRLGRNLDDAPEAAGRTYSELPDEMKAAFLSYGLDFDVFVQATDEEVREVFRRMNSFTVPLNPEEQRHATYQGPFKWFIRKLAADYDSAFIAAGTFSESQVVRMQDTKLLTEVATAYFEGITTTRKPQLDRTYRDRDKGDSFEGQAELDRRMRAGLDFILGFEDLFRTPLLGRTHVVYSLLLAGMHTLEPIPALIDQLGSGTLEEVDRDRQLENLSHLADALSEDDRNGVLGEFVVASSDKTNVATQRVIRCAWLHSALIGSLDY